MKKYLFCLAAIVFGLLTVQAGKTKVVAHRGYWTAPGSAQNSIRSLIKADSIGCDATEFDVYMTSDNVLVLNHDGVINGYPVAS
ncbi:MAG: glycerophosphodiester phosphodiesterase, partial [Muribaculaceae bacterium]|nr:glycerophosphodiester phosphodiesterase [Muribaculaceae bacterium]